MLPVQTLRYEPNRPVLHPVVIRKSLARFASCKAPPDVSDLDLGQFCFVVSFAFQPATSDRSVGHVALRCVPAEVMVVVATWIIAAVAGVVLGRWRRPMRATAGFSVSAGFLAVNGDFAVALSVTQKRPLDALFWRRFSKGLSDQVIAGFFASHDW